ncbi:hypothetical protein ACHAXR_001193, partial [Thalassiosira sp. AJA248-18]
KRQQEVFLVACLALLLAVWFLTPLSDYATTLILWTVPIKSDISLGKEALISLEQKYPPVMDRWGVRKIGLELVNSSKYYYSSTTTNTNNNNNNDNNHNGLFENVKQYKWDFGVVHAPDVNAFALPGGIVRVTDALLQNLALTDSELAALIGHEMGHVLHRHSQKRAVKNRLLSTIWEAFVYEDHDGYDESFGEAVAEGLWKSASYLGELAFSRADEYQADEASWDLLASTYSIGGGSSARQYHPKSVRRLLRKLWEYQGGSGSTSWESTHPGTKDRIDALGKKWNSLTMAEKRKFVG